MEDYYQNKVRANARFRYQENGKISVSTSGYVDEVEEHYVTLTPSRDEYWPQSLYCYYADTSVALELTRGEHVSVIGRVSGDHGYSSRIHMFRCEFEGMQLEMNPSISIQKLSANVVEVYCTPNSIFSTGSKGTGIIVDAEEGLVLTVHHIVADENECGSIEVQLQGSESRIAATPVKHCASIDRARLSISPQSLSDLSLQPIFRASAPAQTDQEIFFWGYGSGELRMESGIVQDVRGKDIIADAYAVPGDSGSPVFDESGHLLGTMSRGNRSDRAVFTGDEC
ncbi:MAG: serine protease [Chloroflexota bacterium]|nr:serine protease [Chloroflexota bacterium]